MVGRADAREGAADGLEDQGDDVAGDEEAVECFGGDAGEVAVDEFDAGGALDGMGAYVSLV